MCRAVRPGLSRMVSRPLKRSARIYRRFNHSLRTPADTGLTAAHTIVPFFAHK